MTGNDFRQVGFRAPHRHALPLTRRKTACAQLIATLALVLSIAVAATAVSIGIARADSMVPLAEGGSPGAAIMVALFLAGLGIAGAAITRGIGRLIRRS